MATSRVVRGYGPLDLFLAKLRCKTAERLIILAGKNGRILDIGCGSYPLFLATIDFSEKYGLDRNIEDSTKKRMKEQGIILLKHHIEREDKLPFQDDYFDVVSMLAVFEHIAPEKLVAVHKEIYRILKPGGMHVITTPAYWTDALLKFLARIRLISDVEIEEHKGTYNCEMITSVLQQANFRPDKFKFGYFELFMNTWATAIK
jgi:ubiquinone/menaquinone biosynthesis C-methylase UbiE